MPHDGDDPKRSRGASVLRHEWPPRARLATGDAQMIQRISEHISRHLGPVEDVLHEVVSEHVHIDVHHVPPRAGREWHTFVTSGMSERPMKVPAELKGLRHGELLLCLPPSWPIGRDAFEDERHYWPIRWLKQLARLPHEYRTWLGWGHTVPNGDPPEPFAENTRLCCMMLTSPRLVPAEFAAMPAGRGKTVYYYAAVPLYPEEVDFKLRQGAESLDALLEANHVTELVDPHRRNVCAGRVWN